MLRTTHILDLHTRKGLVFPHIDNVCVCVFFASEQVRSAGICPANERQSTRVSLLKNKRMRHDNNEDHRHKTPFQWRSLDAFGKKKKIGIGTSQEGSHDSKLL